MSAPLVTVGLNLASSILGSVQANKDLKAQYKAAERQYKMNVSATRLMLNSLNMRTNTQSSEITRDKIRQEIDIEKSAIKAEGSRRVQAAQMGIAGKRAALFITQDIDREKANLISDTEINAEIQQRNLRNQYYDRANQAITNLNNSIPNVQVGQSPWEAGLNTAATLVQTYNTFDKYDKAEFKQDLNSIRNTVSSYF